MRKLSLVSLAVVAAAALPAAAEAQPRAGHSWGQPGAQRVIVRHGGPQVPGMDQRQFRREFRRFGHGQIVPRFWWGPQFQVRHWQMYGFPQPMPGHRWVRYYDDAYMIDDRGRVRDHRYGLDWDRYGDRWAHDESGIPVYVGDGDFEPGERDYAIVDRYRDRRGHGGWDYSEYQGEAYARHAPACGQRAPGPCGPPAVAYPAPHPYPAPAYGYGYGYGYGCCATVTITETIVETGASHQVVEEIVEEHVVRQRARRRAAPPPRRPIRGERG